MNTDQIRDLFEEDISGLLEYYQLLLGELNGTIADFNQAAARKDHDLFVDTAHKTKTFVHFFQADSLQEHMLLVRSIYRAANWAALPEAHRQLLQEMECALEFLRGEIQLCRQQNCSKALE